MTPWEATIGTAWSQPTWRNEQRVAPTWAPTTAALSFDGKRWVSVESLQPKEEK